MVQFANLDREFGYPEGTIRSLIQQESRGNVNAVSPVGARGAAQFMPGTRDEMIREHGLDPWSQDINVAARCAAIYLDKQCDRFGGDLQKGLAAYNAGGGNVNRAVRESATSGRSWLSHLRTETQNYVPQILGRLGIEMEEIDQASDYSERRAAGQTTAEEDRAEEARRRDLLSRAGAQNTENMSPNEILGQMFFSIISAIIQQAMQGQETTPDAASQEPVHVENGTTVAPTPVQNAAAVSAPSQTPVSGRV